VSFEARAIASWKTWAPGLRTLRLEGPPPEFKPGQFVRLALPSQPELARSYSLSSAPGAPTETYLVEVPGGALTPGLFERAVGQEILLDTVPQGHFVLERVPPCRELWLVATGTGLGPYVSMLRSEQAWERAEEVIVVHGVREGSHLAYAEELQALAHERGRSLRWVGLVSREDPPEGALGGRLTSALESGALEEAAGVEIRPDASHIMVCGNPAMIRDLRALLEARGLARNRPRKPGQFTTEKYW
jgi:ferredoxin/flavodoxin---NADP+ reductase